MPASRNYELRERVRRGGRCFLWTSLRAAALSLGRGLEGGPRRDPQHDRCGRRARAVVAVPRRGWLNPRRRDLILLLGRSVVLGRQERQDPVHRGPRCDRLCANLSWNWKDGARRESARTCRGRTEPDREGRGASWKDGTLVGVGPHVLSICHHGDYSLRGNGTSYSVRPIARYDHILRRINSLT